MTDIDLKSEKKNPIGRILIILVLFLVLVVGGGVFLVYKNTTAENFLYLRLRTLNVWTRVLLQDKENLSFDYNKNHLIQKSLINISATGEKVEGFDGLALDIRNTLSFRENYFDMNAYLKQDDAQLGVNLYMQEDNIYLECSDLDMPLLSMKLDQNYFDEIDDIFNNNTLGTEDIIYLVDTLSKYIQESLTENNTTTSRKGLEFTFKYIIDNKNNDDPFIKKFIEKVGSDEELLRILSTNKSELEKELSNLENLELTIVYNIATRKYIDVNLKTVEREEDGLYEEETHLMRNSEGYKLTIKSDSFLYTVDIKTVEEGTNFVVYDKEEKELELLLYDTSDDLIKVSGTLFAYATSENDIDRELKFTIKFKTDNNTISYKGNLEYPYDNDNIINFKYDITEEIRKDSVLKGDFKDAKDLSSLTEKEFLNIETKFIEKIEEFPLYKAAQGTVLKDVEIN